MNGSDNNYLYLNCDPSWRDFQMAGLEINDQGALHLSSVPLLESDLPKEISALPVPAAPAGVAVDVEGTIYFSDPDGNRVWRIDGCSGGLTPVPCIGAGDQPGQLNRPRGLLIPTHRHALFVADSLNHRIAIFDLNTFQLLELWGQDHLSDKPRPGANAGQFNEPWALAADVKGNVYVVDSGNRRIQKFNLSGDVVPGFWNTLSQEHLLDEPTDIASDPGATTNLYVIDRAAGKVFVIDSDGHSLRDPDGHPVAFGYENMEPMGIVATANKVYVGDNSRGRVLTFTKSDGTFVFAGEAVGYHGPVAALTLDKAGDLLVHSGGSPRPLRLGIEKGFRTKGLLWSKPITPASPEVTWHSLITELEALAPAARLQFFVHTADDPNDAPADPSLNAGGGNPFADPRWKPVSPDVSDFLIDGLGRYLWIAALFSGNGTVSPVVSQIRVQFNHRGYDEYLPAIYRDYASCGDFLRRLLSLCESFYVELEDQIDALPAFFDPAAVPAEFLPWLADWLSLELDENWDEALKRRLIGEAFEMFGQRGTVEGLRKALRIFAGVEAVIEEPILNTSWWALPAEKKSCTPNTICPDTTEKNWQGTENSLLGVSTMLAPAEAQGAVLGTSAVLDRSHLIADNEFAAPLFEDVAHQFTAQIYRGQLKCANTLPQIRRVIDREKPAHTAYHLCVIEPRMRVGFQARVGIDTFIAGEAAEMRLNQGLVLGEKTALAGESPGYIGAQSRVGLTTRVG